MAAEEACCASVRVDLDWSGGDVDDGEEWRIIAKVGESKKKQEGDHGRIGYWCTCCEGERTLPKVPMGRQVGR